MQVSTFFNAPMLLVITYIDSPPYSVNSGVIYSGLVACFKMEIEHENLHRNTTKNHLLLPAADQQHKRVVSKSSVCW